MVLTISKQIDISLPIGKVFDFISYYPNDIKWRDGVLEMKQLPQGKTEMGSETFETIKFMGRKLVVKAKVVEFDMNKRLSFKSVSAPIETWGFREVRDLGNGKTEMKYELSANLTGLYKLFSSSIEKMFSKRIENDLLKLKSILQNDY
ncbi:MAG: SRPBCC family protein [Ignavibacteriaceae bacterium]